MEDVRCGRYNVQVGRGKRKVNSGTALYTPDMKPGRGIDHGGDRGGIGGNEKSRVPIKDADP